MMRYIRAFCVFILLLALPASGSEAAPGEVQATTVAKSGGTRIVVVWSARKFRLMRNSVKRLARQMTGRGVAPVLEKANDEERAYVAALRSGKKLVTPSRWGDSELVVVVGAGDPSVDDDKTLRPGYLSTLAVVVPGQGQPIYQESHTHNLAGVATIVHALRSPQGAK